MSDIEAACRAIELGFVEGEAPEVTRDFETVIAAARRKVCLPECSHDAEAIALWKHGMELHYARKAERIRKEWVATCKQLAAEREARIELEHHLCVELDKCEQAEARLADYEADFRAVMAEDCAPDERHCSCVPHLRERVAVLEAALLEIRDETPDWRSREIAVVALGGEHE